MAITLRIRAALGVCLTLLAFHGCAGHSAVVLRNEMLELDDAALDVRWMAPQLETDRTSLDNWRSYVGPPVLISGSGAASGPADRLVVVNWNMHVGGGDIVGLFKDVTSQSGGAPIVFLLQEAYREGPEVPVRVDRGASFASMIRSLRPDGSREEIASTARRLGLHAYYVPSMRNGAPASSAEDRGNAILSTLPLGELTAIELPFERQRRVAVAATVQGVTRDGTPWRVRVVSAHLDNMVGARRLWIAGGEFGRTRQARGLVSALQNEGPLVLGADLNSWFGFQDGAYRTAAAAFPSSPVTDRRATFHGLLRLDHLFFRLDDGWGAQFVRADNSYGSDHYPLVGEIRFETRAQ
jgi:endonuclease/exonuclease/phosphatase family metal-dependent hydrolase